MSDKDKKQKPDELDQLLADTFQEMPWSEEALDILMKRQPQYKLSPQQKERLLEKLINATRQLETTITFTADGNHIFMRLPKSIRAADMIALRMADAEFMERGLRAAMDRLHENIHGEGTIARVEALSAARGETEATAKGE